MTKLRVDSFGMSLDGYSAGTDQSLENPLGVDGPKVMDWFMKTRTWREMQGQSGGETGVDDSVAREGFGRFGAWILGRNMFGPIRGEWPDDNWKGWWGDNPPYHVPTFVLTHYPRPPIHMEGGTVFHFVTDGIHSAYKQAVAAAGEKDVRLGGGVSTVRQFLEAQLVDQLHVAVRPVLLGAGESLFAGLNLRTLGYECSESIAGERATHMFIRKVASAK